MEPKIEFVPSPNFSASRSERVSLIVLHGTEAGFESAVRWLCDGKREHPTSAHYVIAQDGRIAQLVDEVNVAWHAGSSSWQGRGGVNQRSIGIELEHSADPAEPYPPGLMDSCLWLCKRLCRKYGLSPEDIVGHADIAPGRKTDPAGFPWQQFRAQLVERLQEVDKCDA